VTTSRQDVTTVAGSKAFPEGFKLTLHPERLGDPLKWRKPQVVFVNSMSDLFHPEIPDEFITSVFTTMANADRHTFQVLTKRPQRMSKIMGRLWVCDCNYGTHALLDSFYRPERVTPLPNVWLGVTIESDAYAFRARHLRATPAAVRFISAEPLLSPLPSLDLEGIDWLIVGCESGRGARPFELDWARDLRDRCAEAGVAYFVKQLPGEKRGSVLHDLSEFPADLRVRQYPETMKTAA
jgi:protein gp37